MNKQVTVLFFLAALAACSGPAGEPDKMQPVAVTDTVNMGNPKVNPTPSIQYSPLLQQYAGYLQKLDTLQLSGIEQALQQFAVVCQGQPAIVCDTAFDLLNTFHEKAFHQAEKDTIDLSPLILYDEDGKRPLLSDRILARQAALKAHGITIEAEEGTAFLAQDWAFLAKQAETRVTPAMQEYLVHLAKEQEQGFQNDGGLMITPLQLAERVIWREKFAKEQPGFLYANKVVEQQQYFFTWLLSGMENTRAAEDGVLAPEFKLAFEYIRQHYKGTDTERYVTPYLNAYLEKNPAKAEQLLENYRRQNLIL